jgi:hypothetical protein
VLQEDYPKFWNRKFQRNLQDLAGESAPAGMGQ